MNKVTIKDEQLDFILKIHSFIQSEALQADISSKDIGNILLHGYRVKQKYESGDWLYDTRREESFRLQEKNVEYANDPTIKYNNYLRLASPTEIRVGEREERWWNKHGRQVEELKVGDILIEKNKPYSCEVKFVEEVSLDVLLVDGKEDEAISSKHVLDKYSVLCFVEDRKDLKQIDENILQKVIDTELIRMEKE